MTDATEIANLLYRYCVFIDAGDIISACALFKHAELKMITSPDLQDYKAMLDFLQQVIIIYPDGSPKTKHVVLCSAPSADICDLIHNCWWALAIRNSRMPATNLFFYEVSGICC